MGTKVTCFVWMMLLVLAVSSCSSTGEQVSGGAENTDTATVPAVEETTQDGRALVMNSLADRDYGGYEFRILDRGSGDWMTFDVYAEEMTGEPINDAVFERNNILEEKLNIKIVEVPVDAVAATLQTSVLAQSDEYDTATDGLSALATLVSPGYLLDYREIPSVIASNPWWDQQIYSDLSIANKSFFMTGDISVMDNYGTWCMLFNKDILNDFGLDNPYEMVNAGTWTIDKMNEMSAAVTIDLNGDGKFTAEDQYGFVTEGYNTYGLWACFGFKMAEKDANDLPVYVYNQEAAVTGLMKSVETQYSIFTNLGQNQSFTREDQFSSGKALFYFAGMRNITLFRDSEVDFGIIPAPKYQESQEQYWSTYSYSNLTAYSIPVTASDPQIIGEIMESMAALSVYTLTPAYFDVTLIAKAARDQESEAMINLILNSRNFDLGQVFDWGGVFSQITGMKDPSTIVSIFERFSKSATKTLDRFVENLVMG